MVKVRAGVSLARGLWIVWAIVVWNVVFDHVIVVAGREYLAAAIVAAHGGRYARMDDWMQPAITRGLWVATASSATILLVGFAAIRRAATPTAGPPSNGPHSPTGSPEGGPHAQSVQREGVA